MYSLLKTQSLPLELCFQLNISYPWAGSMSLFVATSSHALSYNRCSLTTHQMDLSSRTVIKIKRAKICNPFGTLLNTRQFTTYSEQINCWYKATGGKATKRAFNEKSNQTEEVCQLLWFWQEGTRSREVKKGRQDTLKMQGGHLKRASNASYGAVFAKKIFSLNQRIGRFLWDSRVYLCLGR